MNNRRIGARLLNVFGEAAALLLFLDSCHTFDLSTHSSAKWSKPAFVPSCLGIRSRLPKTAPVVDGVCTSPSQTVVFLSKIAEAHLNSNSTNAHVAESDVALVDTIRDGLGSAAPRFTFPQPPPAPSDQELHQFGLPSLVRAAEHAAAGRTLLTELPDNGEVEVSYARALMEAGRVAGYLLDRLGRVDASGAVAAAFDQSSGEETKEASNGRISAALQYSSKIVAHLASPGSEFVASIWGTWASGRCSVPLAVSQRAPELLHALNETRPDIILIGGGISRKRDEDGIMIKTQPPKNLNELLQAAESAGMSDRVVYLCDIMQGLEDTKSGQPSAESSDRLGNGGAIPSMDSPALVMFTSGTTGKPKGVLSTHRNIYHQITDLVWAWGWTPDDAVLHLLPLHHVHGLVNILCCAAYAGAIVDFQPFHCQDLWWKLATETSHDTACGMSTNRAPRHKPNVLMAVPTIYAKLLEAAEILPPDLIQKAVDETLRPMRLMVCGSAALPVSVLERWRDLTGQTLLERYGMTEFAMALSNPYKPEEFRLPGHVGLPLPSVEVRIVDEETGEVIPKDRNGKSSGGLQVRGPTVFREYLNLPDVTKKEFAEDGSGFFKTGDIAEFDNEAGSYKILGRASVDIIKNGGHKLSALEIERDLLEHPSIQELAVVGVKDSTWGERVGMICRMHRGCDPITLPDLREWADGRMARYKVPSKIMVVDSIPKNHMGKVNKKELRLLFEENR